MVIAIPVFTIVAFIAGYLLGYMKGEANVKRNTHECPVNYDCDCMHDDSKHK